MSGLPTLGHGTERSAWFWNHFGEAADRTILALAEGGVGLEGERVADIGCGEGITDLGLALRAAPAELVGYDINPTDTARLLEEARREGVSETLPANLRFEICQPTVLPAANESFDVVLSWSAFEHIEDPATMMLEIARILAPTGVFMLQLWPFYHSEHGSHLWEWFREGFAQFRYSDAEIERHVRADDSKAGLGEMLLGEYARLNRVTLDDLGRAIRAAGMRVARLEPVASPVVVPPQAADVPLSQLSISGVILLAIPASRPQALGFSAMSTPFVDTGLPPQPPRALAARIGGSYEDLRDIAASHRQVIDDILPEDWDYRGKAVLDFGCGVGRTVATYHDLRGETEIVGCDIHRPSIEWATEAMSPPFTFFVCEEEPPLEQPDERFDLVYACSVFTHITDAWARWLVELHRVLRPGGVLVSSVLNRPMIEPVFGRQWDDRIGMAPAFLGRGWDAGGPCVLLSEWWIREHWGRAFDILRFDEGVEHEGARVGYGWVVGRRGPEKPTSEGLTAIDPEHPREGAAMQYNLEILSAEARQAGERATQLEHDRAHLLEQVSRLENERATVLGSKSWKLTAPLRRAAVAARAHR